MQYADLDYYAAFYGMPSEKGCAVARRALREASLEIDRQTACRLRDAAPDRPEDAETVRDCCCAVADALCKIAQAQESGGESVTVNGVKMVGTVTSVSAGSESISVKAADTSISEAARDSKKRDALVLDIIRRYLSDVTVGGVCVLYCGVM